MKTTKNLNSIAVNDIFSQVVKTDPIQEAPREHGQMSFERVYKMFEERSIAVSFKDYKQMEDMEMLSGINPEPLTAEHKQKSLRAANIIKLKRSKKLKFRMCSNWAPRRKFVPREETKLPKTTLEGLLDAMVVGAYEDRKVATFDVYG